MIRSDNPPDNGVSGAMYLFGTALLWSFIGILVRANSQSALLIGAVTAIFMALFILLVGRPGPPRQPSYCPCGRLQLRDGHHV